MPNWILSPVKQPVLLGTSHARQACHPAPSLRQLRWLPPAAVLTCGAPIWVWRAARRREREWGACAAAAAEPYGTAEPPAPTQTGGKVGTAGGVQRWRKLGGRGGRHRQPLADFTGAWPAATQVHRLWLSLGARQKLRGLAQPWRQRNNDSQWGVEGEGPGRRSAAPQLHSSSSTMLVSLLLVHEAGIMVRTSSTRCCQSR